MDTAQVTVNNVAPTPDTHGPYSGTISAPIRFDASATDPSSIDTAAGFTYSWDFGDGTTGTGVNPTHAYATAGTYTVTLKAQDKDGGSNSIHTSAVITTHAGSTGRPL